MKRFPSRHHLTLWAPATRHSHAPTNSLTTHALTLSYTHAKYPRPLTRTPRTHIHAVWPAKGRTWSKSSSHLAVTGSYISEICAGKAKKPNRCFVYSIFLLFQPWEGYDEEFCFTSPHGIDAPQDARVHKAMMIKNIFNAIPFYFPLPD